MIDGLREGLVQEMRLDESVMVMGEDVVAGIMGPTKGLVEIFGPERIRNTPISEAAITAVGLAASSAGLRPVVDLQFANLTYLATDMLIDQAAKLRYMMNGAVEFPVVFLAMAGAAGSTAAQASDAPWPIYMNSGGLRVCIPSSPGDAKGLLAAAIRDPNPVMFFYHAALENHEGEIPSDEHIIPLGSGRICKSGNDVSVVSWGWTLRLAIEAAEELRSRGLSAEVVDLRTLYPIDEDVISTSIAKTGRLVVVDDARRTCSAGSEIVARVAMRCWQELKASPRLVTTPDTPLPFSPPLERALLPSVVSVVESVEAVIDG